MPKSPPYKQTIEAYGTAMADTPSQNAYSGCQKIHQTNLSWWRLGRHLIILDMTRQYSQV